MTPASTTHHVFVDFENVPDIDLELVAGHPVKVTLLIGKHQRKLGLDLVRQIHRLAEQVELVEVGASGHNALDITLAYYLGRSVPRDPAGNWYIVSGDKDFDPLIAHLKREGLRVSRHHTMALLPFLSGRRKRKSTPSPAATKPPQPPGRLERFVGHLQDPRTTRPKTKSRLLGLIGSYFGGDLGEAERLRTLQELIRRRVVVVDSQGRVSYPAPN